MRGSGQGAMTIIVIAHRLSTIREADDIIVMEQGEVAERGSHQELLQNDDGVYKQLVQRQLSKQAQTGILGNPAEPELSKSSHSF